MSHVVAVSRVSTKIQWLRRTSRRYGSSNLSFSHVLPTPEPIPNAPFRLHARTATSRWASTDARVPSAPSIIKHPSGERYPNCPRIHRPSLLVTDWRNPFGCDDRTNEILVSSGSERRIIVGTKSLCIVCRIALMPSRNVLNINPSNLLVSGKRRMRSFAFVMTPSVPSDPMRSCLSSGPEADAGTGLVATDPDGETSVRLSTMSSILPYCVEYCPADREAIQPPSTEN